MQKEKKKGEKREKTESIASLSDSFFHTEFLDFIFKETYLSGKQVWTINWS